MFKNMLAHCVAEVIPGDQHELNSASSTQKIPHLNSINYMILVHVSHDKTKRVGNPGKRSFKYREIYVRTQGKIAHLTTSQHKDPDLDFASRGVQ